MNSYTATDVRDAARPLMCIPLWQTIRTPEVIHMDHVRESVLNQKHHGVIYRSFVP
jgi:hypothetical protein